jgi:release factor glutamine methyltransferase
MKEASLMSEQFQQWYARSQHQAKAARIPVENLDWLVVNFLNVDKLALRLQQVSPTSEQLAKLDRLWQQHLTENIPLQYLVGKVIWRDLELQVNNAVLIPRPETELLVEIALEFASYYSNSNPTQSQTWLDLGTGSGAIAIALALALPDAQIHAVDYSAAALQIAIENAKQNLLGRTGLTDRFEIEGSAQIAKIANLQFHQGSWFEPVTNCKHQFTGIVSNPPYIPSAAIAHLQPEVAKHEPHLALDGGDDGLEIIKHLINTSPDYLIPGGFWAVELMAGQADQVRSLLLANSSYAEIKAHKDYAGIDRFVSAIHKLE